MGRIKSRTTSSMTKKQQRRTAAQSAAAPAKRDGKSIPDHVTPQEGLRGTAVAPARVATHTNSSNDERRRQVAASMAKEAVKPLVKADEKAVKAAAAAKFVATPRNLLTSALCHDQNADTLRDWCKAHSVKGYSALRKDELVALVLSGNTPAPTSGSARAVREEAKTLKAAGKLSGPVSSASKAALEAAIADAKSGGRGEVSKPTPRAGSCDDMRNRLRSADGKYDAKATAQAKCMFSGRTISALKADQLRQLCAKLGR